MPDDLKELMYAFYHYFYLDGSRKAMHEQNMLRFHSLVKNPAIARPVVELQEKYVALAKQNIGETLSLMGHENLEDCKTGEELFREILKPFEGKLVYLDVWGTWCSPCRKALSKSKEEFERLAPYDVIFLYLANNSDEESWKNVIKEYEVTGDNVVHYNLPNEQQSAVENFLKVNQYPTYRLIDRNGNLLDANADPRNLDAFDTLYIGAEKFPQRNFYPIATSGVL